MIRSGGLLPYTREQVSLISHTILVIRVGSGSRAKSLTADARYPHSPERSIETSKLDTLAHH